VQKPFVAGARFLVPETPQGFVARPELVDRLETTAAPLTLVIGAPGTGKTAVLASWVAQRSAPTVWLTCDPADIDPVRFWWALAVAIEQVIPDAGVDALGRLDDESRESPDAAASLASDCAEVEGLGIVVDDFHYAGAAPSAMEAFIRSLPPRVHLTLASRRDPSVAVGRLRVQGRLLEIREEDLRFGDDEARRLFANLHVDITDTKVGRFCEFTEGWVAGLQLAALSLAGGSDAESLLDAFAETDRGLGDFLVNEVLDLQPPDVQDFLMETSVLDSFDGPLCDAITEREDSGDLLRRLHEAHLFVIELGRPAGWYRYHHLFAAFLQGRLRTRSPERLRRVHASASGAYADRGDLMSAVDHAMAADDIDVAFRHIRRLGSAELDFTGRYAALHTLRAWLRQHGHRYLTEEPRLVLEACVYLAALESSSEIDVWLHRVEHAGPRSNEPATAALLAGVRALHLLHQGDPAAALRQAYQAARIQDDAAVEDYWVSQWPIVACQAQLWLDEPAAARQIAEEARLTAQAYPVFDGVRLPGMLAWAAVVEGELPAAEQHAHLALDAAESLGLPPMNFGRILPNLSLAAVARERRELDEAERLVSLASGAASSTRRPPTTLLCLLEQARLAAAQGATDIALTILVRARQTMPAPTPAVTDHIDRLEARIAIDAGRAGAGKLVDRLSATPSRLLLQARVALMSDVVAAREMLDGAVDRMSNRRLRVEHGLLTARVLARTDRRPALESLGETLRLAEPVGLVTTVVDEGPEIRDLLKALPRASVLEEYVARLLDAVSHRASLRRGRAVRPLVEPVSDRELTVLRYLASRLTYQQIADELYISVNTVKSHVRAAYRKLGATTRSDAVEAARRIGLL
jgi:LuxR family maltose regulon positive regulatory protein